MTWEERPDIAHVRSTGYLGCPVGAAKSDSFVDIFVRVSDICFRLDRKQDMSHSITLAHEIRAARMEQDAERGMTWRANRQFVQVYPKGWARLQSLIRTNPSAARLYALLAEHIDPQGGVVVAAQQVLADLLGVNERTIRRLTKQLEDELAIIRIRVGSGTYAYALDPAEVWRAWDAQKDHAVFRTRTLVSKGGENAMIKRRLQVMIAEQRGEPELPLGDDFDPETGEVFEKARAS